jgi:periplasmic protein TonB
MMKRYDNFDDLVFKARNREYGAFVLRKKYNRYVIISIIIAITLMTAAIIAPFLSARSVVDRHALSERKVEIVMQDLDQPHELVAPPPPPPKSVPVNVVEQAKYVPPVVVDSIKPEETVQQTATTEETHQTANNEPLEIKENNEEVPQEETEEEPFLNVQEMPKAPGGEAGMYKYIAANTQYPLTAKKNNIQGKVYVRFCITAKGTVEQVSILKGVDPELDEEAIRVVKTFPPFKPGKQDGKPVPVWFIVPINFQIF